MVINPYSRYQVGLSLNDVFPSIKDICACGCNRQLPKRRHKWFSNECRDLAFLNFAVLKGDNYFIRQLLYEIDKGACRICGVIAESWQADHIIPVYKGGGGRDITNFQTLCVECHFQKTFNDLKLCPTTWLFPRKQFQSFSLTSLMNPDSIQIVPQKYHEKDNVFYLQTHSWLVV